MKLLPQSATGEQGADHVWTVLLSSSDSTFPELEISLNKATSPQLEYLAKLRALATTAKELAEKWTALEATAPELVKDMRLSSPRLVKLSGGREGAIASVPGMAGTGFTALLPITDSGYLLVLTMSSVEQVGSTPQTKVFQEQLLSDPASVLEKIALATDAALSVQARSAEVR